MISSTPIIFKLTFENLANQAARECENCRYNPRMVIFTDYQTSSIPNGAFFLVPFDANYKGNSNEQRNKLKTKEINNFEKDIPLNPPSFMVEGASESNKIYPNI